MPYNMFVTQTRAMYNNMLWAWRGGVTYSCTLTVCMRAACARAYFLIGIALRSGAILQLIYRYHRLKS